MALPVAGSGAGLFIGPDVQLYRSAADVLYIPDSVTLTGALIVGGIATFSAGAIVSGANNIEWGGDASISRTAAATLTIANNLIVSGVIQSATNEISSALHLVEVTSDPAYVDGHVLLYFYSSAGVDELRVRGKVGATETQVTLADITP
jgi:hypothetical protein